MSNRLHLVSISLALSTAIVALPAFAQDATPSFQLDGTGGIVGFNVPGYDNGLGNGAAGGNLFGGMIGGKISANLGETNGWGVVLGLKGFAAIGMGSGPSTTTHLTGTGTFSGLDAGGGTISLATPGANATSNVTGPGGGNATTATVGGPADVAAITPDGTGFEYSVVTSDGANGNAYGGIGSSSGGRFQYDGPVDDRTTVSRSIFYAGSDLTIGLNGTMDGATNVMVYGGPSIRFLGQKNTTTHTFDVPEVPTGATPITIPTFSIALNDNLMSTYLGGVIGGDVSFNADGGIVYTLGLEGGIYAVHSSWEAHDTYSTCCGLTGTPQTIPSPTISVDGPTHKADVGNTIAFAAQGSGSATIPIDASKSFTFGGNLGYLSYVPTVTRSGSTVTFGSGSMITYGVNGTLSGHF